VFVMSWGRRAAPAPGRDAHPHRSADYSWPRHRRPATEAAPAAERLNAPLSATVAPNPGRRLTESEVRKITDGLRLSVGRAPAHPG